MAFLLLAATAAIAIASPAPAWSDCPSTLFLGSTDSVHYIASFGAMTASTISFQITLYSEDAVYNVSLPHVEIRTPVTSRSAKFRSNAIVILNPKPEPLVGATISSESTVNCSPYETNIESAEVLRSAHRYTYDPDLADLLRHLSDETGDGSDGVIPAPSQTLPPACALPFSPAKPVHIFQPMYPDAAEGASGIAYILVTLNDSGAVTDTSVWRSSGNWALDAAARNAALRSDYAPGTFACHPRGGRYIFDAVF
jgi:TonB family protein